jgi:hypothetical protein
MLERVLNTTQLPELALSTAQIVCKTCNGTLNMVNNSLAVQSRAERVKRKLNLIWNVILRSNFCEFYMQ